MLHPIAWSTRSAKNKIEAEEPKRQVTPQAAMSKGLPGAWQSKQGTDLRILLPRWKAPLTASHTLQGQDLFLKWNDDSLELGFPSHKVTRPNSYIEFCCCLSLFGFCLLLLLFPFKPSYAFEKAFSPYPGTSEEAVHVFFSRDTPAPNS